MSFLIDANGKWVSHGSDAALDNLAAWTLAGWYRFTALTAVSHLWSKPPAAGGGTFIVRRGSGANNQQIFFIRFRAGGTTNTVYETNDSPLSVTGSWQFVAVTFDDAATPEAHIYVGSPTVPAVESSYGTATDGAGALDDDSANNLIVGNTGTGTSPALAYIGYSQMWNRALLLGELHRIQLRPLPTAGSLFLSIYGVQGGYDYTGQGRLGAITGSPTSHTIHPPIVPGWLGAPVPTPYVVAAGFTPSGRAALRSRHRLRGAA